MDNRGKYVRPTEDLNDLSDCDLERDADTSDNEEDITNKNETNEPASNGGTDEDSDSESTASHRSSNYSTASIDSSSDDDDQATPTKTKEASPTGEANPSKQNYPEKDRDGRMEQIEKVLADLRKAVTLLQPGNQQLAPQQVTPEAGRSWDFTREPAQATGSHTTVRPEHIKPYPSGVRPNKMWAEWYDFIEDFEVAVSMHNTNDPVYKMKLLYLSLGKELQSIVKAANLRPSLTDPQCYSIFVKNIETHLRSMTDTTAEHQAFLKMKQGKDESTVTFHARLIRGVKLCGYNADDESRFVRAQLLEGLRNKELAKAARTYGYDTNFIVQSATREEVYEEETAERTVDANILEIGRRSGVGRKRINTHQQFDNPATKQRRTNSDFMRNGPWRPERSRQAGNSTQQARDGQRSPRTQDRNTRCPRCNNLFHRNPQCPALTRTCDNCGKRGHFAVACRSERPNAVQQISKQADAESSGEENVFYEKQVKQG